MIKLSNLFIICLLLTWNLEGNTSQASSGMIIIPGGIFEMGSQKSAAELNIMELLNPDRHALGPEDPAHLVKIDSYYIDVYEVTNEDYRKYLETSIAKEPAFWNNSNFNSPKQPVVGVSWNEANRYCKWLKKRLPTEAEWEKASRGKRHIDFPWGNEQPDKTKLNYNNHIGKTVAVGSYESGKSDYGIYDLSGNVAEWVWDWHNPEYYVFSPKKNPNGPKKGPYKVIRGGHWRNKEQDVRLTYRGATISGSRSKTIGFRCVADKKPIPNLQ